MATMIRHNCRHCGRNAPREGALCDRCRTKFIKHREKEERYPKEESNE